MVKEERCQETGIHFGGISRISRTDRFTTATGQRKLNELKGMCGSEWDQNKERSGSHESVCAEAYGG